ncbi:hypothetical protein FGO68_gene17028 [Halteria grandinella]|uniref:Uncharacterized protein n=1 Tax=Halteria grandinella TaxID=5974 RepID=A0A8J8SUN8_HALGN|nr:hypothetical protein FGO68_gene17028 [Halteria grandinella]
MEKQNAEKVHLREIKAQKKREKIARNEKFLKAIGFQGATVTQTIKGGQVVKISGQTDSTCKTSNTQSDMKETSIGEEQLSTKQHKQLKKKATSFDDGWVERRKKSSIIILLFFLYPTICQYVFSLFNCTLIDKTSRLYEDPEVICYDGLHDLIALWAGLPSLALWVFGIPFYALIQLRSNKDNLHSVVIKEQLGFLYNGFRDSTYYWEIYIMYRKVVVVGVQVFLVTFGLKVQAYAVLLLLMIFLQINLKFRPYSFHALTQLETASLTVCLITTYCGLFYLTASDRSNQSFFNIKKDFYLTDTSIYVLFFAILIANITFMVLWAYLFLIEVRKTLLTKQTRLYQSKV